MAEWLSDEWAAAAAGLCPLLPPLDGVSGTVSLAVGVARRQEIGFSWSYEDGRPGTGVGGTAAGADLVLTVAAADAAAIVSGRVPPSVAFMRGRLKAAGDGRLVLAFLGSTTASSFGAWRERLAALAPVRG